MLRFEEINLCKFMRNHFANRVQKQKWLLKDVHLLSPNYPYIFKAYQTHEQRDVIVKLGVDSALFSNEARALQHYQGHSCVQILEIDSEQLMMLLEFVHPGDSQKHLFPFHDEQAVHACAKVLKALHTAPMRTNENFPTLRDWFTVLNAPRVRAILPRPDLDKAIALADELIYSSSNSILLHGDLHHENILTSTKHGYVAIDPKGVLGDPAFDIAAFIRNPISQLLMHESPKKLIARRFELFSECLSLDLERLRAWAYAGSVLACAWNVEDGLAYKTLLDITQLLEV